MNNNGKSFKKQIFFYSAVVLLLSAMAGTLIFLSSTAKMRHDLSRLSSERYDSIFVSMHSLASYSEDDFLAYRGLNTIHSTYEVRNLKELSKYLDTALSSENEITNIFLALDPAIIWDYSRKTAANWEKLLSNYLFSYAEAYPSVSFEILLPNPSLKYWLDIPSAKVDHTLALYRDFMVKGFQYSNVSFFYLGSQYWLIANPDNYDQTCFDTNEIISQRIFLFTICDHKYTVTSENLDDTLSALRELITTEQSAPHDYPDLSDCTLVFFGDSIIDIVQGSYSIPGYIAGLSHANTISYAHSGTSAALRSENSLDFPNTLEEFLLSNPFSEQEQTTQKQLYFLFNFGLNDYFSGCPIDNPEDPFDIYSYAGSLRSGIARLLALYPDAKVIVMSPPYTNYYSMGTEIMSVVGGQLTDYVDAARLAAMDMNAIFMDNYYGLGINAENLTEYSDDGCHLNEDGRLLLSTKIMELLNNQIAK